jgi:hypothetical protein
MRSHFRLIEVVVITLLLSVAGQSWARGVASCPTAVRFPAKVELIEVQLNYGGVKSVSSMPPGMVWEVPYTGKFYVSSGDGKLHCMYRRVGTDPVLVPIITSAFKACPLAGTALKYKHIGTPPIGYAFDNSAIEGMTGGLKAQSVDAKGFLNCLYAFDVKVDIIAP